MPTTAVLRVLIGLQDLSVRSFHFSPTGLVVDLAPTWSIPRCGECGAKCRSIHDGRELLWGHHDQAGMTLYLRYRIRRAHCSDCGTVKTERVPWAPHGSNFTLAFGEWAAFLAQQCSKTAVVALLRTTWRTVGALIQRLVQDALDRTRKDEIREAEGKDEKSVLKGTRWALQKRPRNLTNVEVKTRAEPERTKRPLFRAHLLKDFLAAVLDGRQINVAWRRLPQRMADARRSRLPHFIRVARTIKKHQGGILEYIRSGLSNGPNRRPQRQSQNHHPPHILLSLRPGIHRHDLSLLRQCSRHAGHRGSLRRPLKVQESPLEGGGQLGGRGAAGGRVQREGLGQGGAGTDGEQCAGGEEVLSHRGEVVWGDAALESTRRAATIQAPIQWSLI